MTGYYLLDHTLTRSQYRTPRRAQPSGVVVLHSAENLPDVNPPDTGAEGVASFIAHRTDPGSYHRVCDSDSTVALVPYDYEAFHDATGTNPHSVGISGAFRAGQWPTPPQSWRDGCVNQMASAAADYARWLQTKRGILIPAQRITVAQARAGHAGFVTHAELDPGRRTDPGAGYPHDQFLAIYAALVVAPPTPAPPSKEAIEMLYFVQVAGDASVYLTDFVTRRGVRSPEELERLRARATWIKAAIGVTWIYEPQKIQVIDRFDMDSIPLAA